jgi:hypothetical protein
MSNTGALFTDVDISGDIEEKQHEFTQDSIVAYARNYQGPSMDCLNMGDIDILADLWDFDMLNVNTLFLLSIYEFGKELQSMRYSPEAHLRSVFSTLWMKGLT